MAREGLISLPSARPVAELLNRLEAALAAKRITVFARIDHAAGAASVGMKLRPTSVLIFGNPQAGTPLMQADQQIGLDLPLRVLAWQDAEGRSWLTYHDPAWLVRYHGVDPGTLPQVPAITTLLHALASDAAG
ncbi:MAG TPA: DUF302 domain-containing protein [Acetobacteraceae bacterium]|nr:DUF302 domain-containing protein [Acetobacteraceae bacterium]